MELPQALKALSLKIPAYRPKALMPQNRPKTQIVGLQGPKTFQSISKPETLLFGYLDPLGLAD